jgi:type IV secretion system protein VirD4
VTVTTALQIWQNPRVCAATEATDFDIREIRRKKMSIYLAIAPSSVARFAPLIRLFFDQLVGYNTERTPRQDGSLSVPTLVLLDEFARLGRMPRVAESLQYARAYGLRFCLLVQNRPQVMATYGSDAATDIWDNVGAECVFSTGDHVLAKQLSERFGDTTTTVITKNRPRYFAWANPAKQSEAEHPHRRPVMLPSEILQLPADEMLILRPGMPGAVAHKIRWWEEERFISRVLPPPRIPQLQVVVAMDDRAPIGRRALSEEVERV